MVWRVTGASDAAELTIEADLPGRKPKFMSALAQVNRIVRAGDEAGKEAALACSRYLATLDLGTALNRHRPGAIAWLDEHQPWYAMALLFDTEDGGLGMEDGKALLVLSDKATALQFKLTWG